MPIDIYSQVKGHHLMIIDEIFHQRRLGCYELTRVHRVDGYTVRIRVCRDFYGFQSTAVADVLAPDRTWTMVAESPWTHWHESTPPVAADAASLTPVADRLLERARRILSPPD